MAELTKNGELKLDSIDTDIVLSSEDLLITMSRMEGCMAEGDNEVTTILDIILSPELRDEGFVRE